MSTPNPEVVVITGATAGVGRAVARKFAADGAKIGLLARGKDRLESTKREVEALGGQALMIPTDIADADALERAAEKVEEHFGPIDIWINNAMVTVYGELQDIEPDEYKRVTDVCYHGTVYGTMSALKRMLPRDRGTIVQVGSALAHRGIPLQAAYCGAKHAAQGMFESLRSELIKNGSNVHVTMVHLPAINTPQFSWGRTKLPKQPQPVPPIYQPEVAGDAIHWAAHTDRREVWVGYPTVQVIAGNRIAPAVGDWYLAKNGFEGQMTDEPVDPNRKDNLFEPVEGDFGAEGEFSDRAKSHSPQLWATKNRGWLALAAGAVAATGAALAAARR